MMTDKEIKEKAQKMTEEEMEKRKKARSLGSKIEATLLILMFLTFFYGLLTW